MAEDETLLAVGLQVSSERYLEIPAEVREVLNLWRPTPLRRASRWEKLLGLPENVAGPYSLAAFSGFLVVVN